MASLRPSLEQRLSQAGPEASRPEIVEAIRDAVMQEVDQRVAAKADELWVRGKQMMNQMQEKHKEKTQMLTEELARCAEKQRSLEAENEKLREVLTTLASRFSALGAAFAGKAIFGSPDAGASTAAGASPPRTEASGSELFTPGPFTPGADPASQLFGAVGEVPLPAIPAFPVLSQPLQPMPGTPAPSTLLLAEALGSQTPQRTPLSLASSLPLTPAEVVSPFPARVPGSTFTFTLRKADGVDLGLDVDPCEDGKALLVNGILSEGAVEAWNRQCAGGALSEKAVLPGDKIASVNNITDDAAKMLEECREKQLLKLTIVHGEWPHADAAATATRPMTLRAEASIFVPSGGTAALAPP